MRIPVLVALLVPVDLLPRTVMAHTDRMDPAAAALPWLGLLAIGVLLMAVVLVRRDADHSRLLLLVEAPMLTLTS